ncbi:hypothetical protein [Yunchengibacter salinarum]|uniref:hypothetical protein n=1 Tax=Yunchengibacter salinarum TaxID=3133399 RepID=UPI0035B5F016
MDDQHSNAPRSGEPPVVAPDEAGGQLGAGRRQLLKLGLAGAPMVFSVRASAANALASAVDCAINVPNSFYALVASDGQAWVATINVGSGKITPGLVNRFKRFGIHLPEGSVDEEFRPGGCDAEDRLDAEAFWNDPLDEDGDEDERQGIPHPGGGDDRDDDDDDDDEFESNGGIPRNLECRYALTDLSSLDGTVIGDLFSEDGAIAPGSRNERLFALILSRYVYHYGQSGSLPGLSCYVSILNYVRGG